MVDLMAEHLAAHLDDKMVEWLAERLAVLWVHKRVDPWVAHLAACSADSKVGTKAALTVRC